MTKPTLDERFADWVDGRLRPLERAALEAQLASDPALAQAAEDYRRTVQVLRGALAPPELEGSVADAVLARVAPEAAARHRPTIRPLFASMMAAAALVLAFLIVRAIPPATTGDVEVSRSARGDGAIEQHDAAKNDVVTGSDRFFMLDGLRPAESAPAGRPEGQVAPQETQVAPAARLPADEGVQVRSVRAEAGEVALRQLLDSAGERKVGVDEKMLRMRRDVASVVREDAKSPADVPGLAGFADGEQLGQWAAGLGELVLVVEPGVTDARASDPLTMLTTIGTTGSAPKRDATRESVVQDQAQLGAVVREVPRVVEAKDARVAAGSAAAEKRPAATTAAKPMERLFVVSGTAQAMRKFARDLQLEVSAHDGRVHFERSLELAKELSAPGAHDEFALGSSAQTRARAAGATPPATTARGAIPAGPAGGAAGAAGPTSPAPPLPVPVRDEHARVELHVIVRVR